MSGGVASCVSGWRRHLQPRHPRPSLADSIVSGNTARGCGGGIDNAGTLTVTDSTVSGNTARISAAASTGRTRHPDPDQQHRLRQFGVQRRRHHVNPDPDQQHVSGNTAAYGGGIYARHPDPDQQHRLGQYGESAAVSIAAL